MAYATRCLLYLVGGGALLTWMNPPRGLLAAVAVLAWIGVCAGVDALLTGASERKRAAQGARRKPRRSRRWGTGGAGAGGASTGGASAVGATAGGRGSAKRGGLHVLFTSHNVAEAEALSAQLRERGLRPMLVTQRGAGTGADVTVEVRLSKDEWRRARPVVSRFSSR